MHTARQLAAIVRQSSRHHRVLTTGSKRLGSCMAQVSPPQLILRGERSIATDVSKKSLHQHSRGLGTSPATSTVSSAAQNDEEGMLEISWADEDVDIYPYIWLRDNCQCEACFHPKSLARTILCQHLDLSVRPTEIQVGESGNDLKVRWSDGHLGSYSAAWLNKRSFRPFKQEIRAQSWRLRRQYWGSEISDFLPRADFNALMTDDSALLTFLKQLEVFGLVIVSDAPTRIGQVQQLTGRVGFLKSNHYGQIFTVQDKISPNNLAYTPKALNLHVDLPFLDNKPGVQLLHCISQFPGKGGDNLLVDACNTANRLKEQYPEKFSILANTPVDFWDSGEENGRAFYCQNQEPLICVDRSGEVQTINFNQMVRDSYFGASVRDVAKWYDAMLTFSQLLTHPDNVIQYKMKNGDIIVFNNLRVMHGRTSYTSGEGKRHLEGAYWDWDYVRSTRRVLQRKLGII